MKKSIFAAYLSILAGIVFLTIGVLSAADVTTPPNDITINSKGYKNVTKGPVVFHHLKHTSDYKLACTDCHHEFKDGKNIWKAGDPVKTCVTCHDPEQTKDKVLKLQTAFHNNCKDCHKKSGKETAPSTKCNDCHSKL